MNEKGVTPKVKITPEPIKSFLTYKQVIQNCSKLTCEKYEHDLSLFFRYIISVREKREFDEVDPMELEKIDMDYVASIRSEDIYSFLLYLANERDNGDNARARRLSTLRAFYKYHTQKSKRLIENPVKDIDSPNIKHKLPKYLSIDESVELLESVKKESKTFERDYCMLTLFLNCGMRLSELVGINLTDIKDDLSSLVVTGKGSKQRMIYLNSACRTALKNYLEVRTKGVYKDYEIKVKDKNALFLSGNGSRISTKTVQYTVKKHLKQAGLGNKGYSTHKLRHTAATLMYESGNVDVRALKDILGHEQLNTTQIYTHVSNDKLKEAMEANPLSGVKPKK